MKEGKKKQVIWRAPCTYGTPTGNFHLPIHPLAFVFGDVRDMEETFIHKGRIYRETQHRQKPEIRIKTRDPETVS